MKPVRYEINDQQIALREQRNEQDTDFLIRAKTSEAVDCLHQLRAFFDRDKVYSDILFYSRGERTWQVIVRRDAYVPFLAHLFQLQLLRSIRWLTD
ncbi:hypothetical protein [Sporolactobacillus sp. THM19-2]|jgi:hypothetical protein|uniref:hypothetical protein n=1 Tax=Sporolactobacillus sp. THM19-2 TaxID=2511171 RepID=UPI00102253A8|nr:hypothetical protein [Sporolactobacillus sp. THM19-2]RYL88466.1 hypothetical protein EWH91_11670 [Sporolactobacillus sp. THM19-2]